MERRADAVIVGAGVAGGSMAKILADQGWDTVLLDGRKFPRHKVCGEFLSPESRNMLRAIGVGEAVEALGPASIPTARLIGTEGETLTLDLPGSAIGISRFALDTVLHEAALQAGAELLTSTTVTSIAPLPREQGYRLELRQGQGRTHTLWARAVIGAWGSHGKLGAYGEGRPLHPAHRSHPSAYIGVKSHYSGAGLADLHIEPAVELYFFPGGYLGLSPIEGGKVNAAAMLDRNAFAAADKSVPGLLEAAMQRNAKLAERLRHALPVAGTQAACAPVELHRSLQPWGLIPHIGDAVVTIPPLCGDGMSMALRSALLCAPLADDYLRGERSLESWRHAYAGALRAEFGRPLRWARLIQALSAYPLMPRLLIKVTRRLPGFGTALLRATRLREG